MSCVCFDCLFGCSALCSVYVLPYMVLDFLSEVGNCFEYFFNKGFGLVPVLCCGLVEVVMEDVIYGAGCAY